MGLGIGINCERCGRQLYLDEEIQEKRLGYKNDLCGQCVDALKQRNWDKEHLDENGNLK